MLDVDLIMLAAEHHANCSALASRSSMDSVGSVENSPSKQSQGEAKKKKSNHAHRGPDSRNPISVCVRFLFGTHHA